MNSTHLTVCNQTIDVLTQDRDNGPYLLGTIFFGWCDSGEWLQHCATPHIQMWYCFN